MSQQTINIGLNPNDRSGDLIRTAFDKVNQNFTELYSAIGADVQIPIQTGSDGKCLKTNGTSLSWGYTNIVSNGLSDISIPLEDGDIIINVDDGSAEWSFNNQGKFLLPSTGTIEQNYTITRGTSGDIVNSSDIVWTSSLTYISSAKLIIQAEADELADSSGWHSQTCEAILSCRGGLSSGNPVMTVYGNVYTSTQPLVTFTAQRNITTNLIEIVGAKTAACNSSVSLRIHSIEISTRD